MTALFLAFAPSVIKANAPAQAQTADGETFAATLQKIDPTNVHFNVNGDTQTVALSELVAWGKAHDTHRGMHVLLADDSVIVADDVRVVDDQLEIDSNLFGQPVGQNLWGTTRLPIEVIRAVVFRVPIHPLQRDLLTQRLVTTDGIQDQLLLVNGDTVNGSLETLARGRGPEGQPGPLAVTIASDGGSITITPGHNEQLLDKVTALVFNPSLVKQVEPRRLRTWLTFADGSRLLTTLVKSNDEQATFQLAAGPTIASHPDENIWPHVTSLRPLGGKVTYLSQHPQLRKEYKHYPLLQTTWPLGENANVLGGKLRYGGHIALLGLGMHSRSRAVYSLAAGEKKFSRLEAELALDDTAESGGSVEFIVLAYNGQQWKPTRSGIVRGGDPPRRLRVDLTGIKAIALAVEPADNATVLDRANWLNLRLVE